MPHCCSRSSLRCRRSSNRRWWPRNKKSRAFSRNWLIGKRKSDTSRNKSNYWPWRGRTDRDLHKFPRETYFAFFLLKFTWIPHEYWWCMCFEYTGLFKWTERIDGWTIKCIHWFIIKAFCIKFAVLLVAPGIMLCSSPSHKIWAQSPVLMNVIKDNFFPAVTC